MSIKSLFLAAALFASAAAFAPQQQSHASTTALSAHEPQKIVAAAMLGAALFASDPVFAFDDALTSSSQLIAGRSGGRVGGRSSSGGASRAPPRVIERQTTIYQSAAPSPVFIAPAPVYNPMPGLGLGLGLSAMNDIGNTMRDYRQETEIQQSKAELQQARIKEAELEARLRNLEISSAASRQ